MIKECQFMISFFSSFTWIKIFGVSVVIHAHTKQTYHATHITLLRVRNCCSLYLIKYSAYPKIFQIKVIGIYEACNLRHCQFLARSAVLEKSNKLKFELQKIEVTSVKYVPKLNLPYNILYRCSILISLKCSQ
jgi:hypothetical protein